jgi:hypothetical protein
MIEGISGVLSRIKEINERISEIQALGGYRSISKINAIENKEERNSSEISGKKFSEILKEVLLENGTLPGLSSEEASKKRLNLILGDKSEDKNMLESLYNTIKSEYTGNENIDDVIKQAAEKFELDPLLIKAVIQQESGFNKYAVSPKGALGLMQLMPKTIELLGIRNPFDVRENIFGGARYLKMLLERYNNDLNLALAAYNAGPTAVEKYEGIPDYEETKNYVENIIKMYNSYKNFK